MAGSATITSREWQHAAHMGDYRSEWLSDVHVERATWSATAPEQVIEGLSTTVKIAGPGFVWLRFWFKTENYVVEKYLSPVGETAGYYIPITMPLEQISGRLVAKRLLLALWIDRIGRILVLGENEFESAAADGTLSPVEVEQAEYRIREMMRMIGQKRFPPALVRNFTLQG